MPIGLEYVPTIVQAADHVKGKMKSRKKWQFQHEVISALCACTVHSIVHFTVYSIFQ